jgi:hypothetical protein
MTLFLALLSLSKINLVLGFFRRGSQGSVLFESNKVRRVWRPVATKRHFQIKKAFWTISALFQSNSNRHLRPLHPVDVLLLQSGRHVSRHFQEGHLQLWPPRPFQVAEETSLRGAIHQLLSIILKVRILVLLPEQTLPSVVIVKNYSKIGKYQFKN